MMVAPLPMKMKDDKGRESEIISELFLATAAARLACADLRLMIYKVFPPQLPRGLATNSTRGSFNGLCNR
jgi:hypothetical protein